LISTLRQRSFGLLWVAGLISLLGDWALYAVLPFYVAKVTGSALATGAISLTELLPNLFLGTFVGVFIDRWNPKKIMIISDLLRAFILLFLFIIQSPQLLWIVYIVAFAESSVSVFFNPAKTILTRRIVNDQDLMSANSLNSISDNVCRLLGPVIGGGFFFLLGLHFMVVVDSLSYILSALLVAGVAIQTISSPPIPQREGEKEKLSITIFVRQWAQGFQFMAKKDWLIILCVCMACSMFSQGIFNALLPLFAERVVKMNAALYGWYLSAQGIGGLAGGFIIGKTGKLLHPTQILSGSLIMAGCFLLIQFIFPSPSVVLITTVIAGIFVVGWIVGLQTIFQRGIEEKYLGRVVSTYGTTQMTALLIGTSGGSLLGDSWGVVPTLILASGLLMLAGVGCSLVLQRFSDKED